MEYSVMVCDYTNGGREFSFGPFVSKKEAVDWLIENKFIPRPSTKSDGEEGQWKRNRGTHIHLGSEDFGFAKELWAAIVPNLKPEIVTFRDMSG